MQRVVNICSLFSALFLPPSVVSGILCEWVLERGSFTAYGVRQTASHYGSNKIPLKDVNICFYVGTAVQFPRTVTVTLQHVYDINDY